MLLSCSFLGNVGNLIVNFVRKKIETKVEQYKNI